MKFSTTSLTGFDSQAMPSKKTARIGGTKAKPLAAYRRRLCCLSKCTAQEDKIRDQSEFGRLVSIIDPPGEFLLFDLNFVF